MKKNTVNLSLSGLCLALALLLPFLTASNMKIGNMFLPMHLPVLLCGYVCGPIFGMAVGLTAPILRSMLFAAPPMLPTACAMAVELCAYAGFCGLLYRVLPQKLPYIYASLVVSLILGRIVWGIASVVFYALNGGAFSWELFVSGAFATAIPGIILQLIVIPPLVLLAQNKLKK